MPQVHRQMFCVGVGVRLLFSHAPVDGTAPGPAHLEEGLTVALNRTGNETYSTSLLQTAPITIWSWKQGKSSRGC